MTSLEAIPTRLLEWMSKNRISRAALAKEIGLSQTTVNNYFKDVNARVGMTADFLYRVMKRYPDIDANWVFRGEGEGFSHFNADVESESIVSQLANDSNAVKVMSKDMSPYYDVDFCGGFDVVMNDQTTKPSGYVYTPTAQDAIWCNLTGHSMSPTISHGDMIALREIKDARYLPYGEIYAIVTDDYRTVKRIGKASKEGFLRLIPDNKNGEYDEQEIPVDTIRRIYSVCGCIKRM